MQAYPVKFSNMLSTAQMVEEFAAFLADYVFSCSNTSYTNCLSHCLLTYSGPNQ